MIPSNPLNHWGHYHQPPPTFGPAAPNFSAAAGHPPHVPPVNHYTNIYRPRRFGAFRRFWWFGLGVGAAVLWARAHERKQRFLAENPDAAASWTCGSHRRSNAGNHEAQRAWTPTDNVPHAPPAPVAPAAIPAEFKRHQEYAASKPIPIPATPTAAAYEMAYDEPSSPDQTGERGRRWHWRHRRQSTSERSPPAAPDVVPAAAPAAAPTVTPTSAVGETQLSPQEQAFREAAGRIKQISATMDQMLDAIVKGEGQDKNARRWV